LLWSSADQYDQGGLRDDTRRMLHEFIASRSNDTRMPRAMLKLGQTYAAQGLFAEANEWFARLIEQYPRLAESARARLLAADSFVALGQSGSAEQVLLDLLETDTVAPDADVYRDALLALCELYYQEGRYADAIGRIENFLEFFSADADGWRLRFMLADSYRRSAYALRDAPDEDRSIQAQQDESRGRFARAAALLEQYLGDAGEFGGTLDAAPMLRRLAMFYRADCLYAINEPRSLELALGVYRQAAATYQSEPATLTAHIQIANIHLRQGRMREAASAIERARWLLNDIADAEFETDDAGMDRGDWERYLGTLLSSHALRNLATSTPRP
jgi:tetratricopeptide (TPR) repeat protein